MAQEYSVIVTTVENKEDGKDLARHLLNNKKVAACVQLLAIDSLYMWEGEVSEDPEILVLIKTRADFYSRVEDAICEIHKYDTPEIIQLPVTAGFAGYLQWIDDVTG